MNSLRKNGAERAKKHRHRHKPVDVDTQHLMLLDRLIQVIPSKADARWTRPSLLRLLIEDGVAKYLPSAVSVTAKIDKQTVEPATTSMPVASAGIPKNEIRQFAGGRVGINADGSTWVAFDRIDDRRFWVNDRGYAYNPVSRTWLRLPTDSQSPADQPELDILIEHFSSTSKAASSTTNPTP